MQPFYWTMGGNPFWLKALLCLGIVAGLWIIFTTLMDMERAYKLTQLRELQDKLAKDYAARFK